MKKRNRKFKIFTLTIVANDANNGVTRISIPKFLIWILSVLPLIPVLLLVLYFIKDIQQQEQISKLTDNLSQETQKNEELQTMVGRLMEQSGETYEYIEELSELELEMREYIDELPPVVGHSGGEQVSAADFTASSENSFKETSDLIDRYKETLAILNKVSEELKDTPVSWPTVPNSITSDFGMREDPFNYSASFHTGIDIKGNYGTPVYAAADGVITLAGKNGGYGNTIKIKHSNSYETLYGHLSEIHVNEGETVKKGDLIGAIGSTGRSTGPHLHYEILKNGSQIDPAQFLQFINE